MLSVFDLFKIGIGPSSSHTVGPMVAGKAFAGELAVLGMLPLVRRIKIELFGSLALTGDGHGTVGAVLAGLEGEEPQEVDIAGMARRTAELQNNADLVLMCAYAIPFDFGRDVCRHKGIFLPRHSNAMTITAFNADGASIYVKNYYSVGGGFIRTDEDFDHPRELYATPPYPYEKAAELFAHCARENRTIAQIVMARAFSSCGSTQRASVAAVSCGVGGRPGAHGCANSRPKQCRVRR